MVLHALVSIDRLFGYEVIRLSIEKQNGQLESGIDKASTRNMSIMTGFFVPGSFDASTRVCSRFHALGDGIKVWMFNVQEAPLERGSVQGLRYSTLNFEQVLVRATIEH